MRIPFLNFNTSAKDQVKSKGFRGGYAMCALGGYLIYTGNIESGLGCISIGYALLGIRDAKNVV